MLQKVLVICLFAFCHSALAEESEDLDYLSTLLAIPCPSMSQATVCSGNGTCNPQTGNCTCNPDVGGVSCGEDIGDASCTANVKNACSQFARCENIATTGQPVYKCECYLGFADSGDGTNCADNNECDLATSCDNNADCHNTIGSYYCTCTDGYQGNGFPGHCTDIDECQLGTDNCGVNTICQNAAPPQKYVCKCADGFQRNTTDPNSCYLPVRAPTQDAPQAPEISTTGYTPIYQVEPSVLCYTTTGGTTVYFQVYNHYFKNRQIGANSENAISIDGTSNTNYPGVPSSYPTGISYPVAPSSTTAKDFGYHLDGYYVSINTADPDFSSHACPTTISMVFPADIPCPADTGLEASIQTKVTAVFATVKTTKAYTITQSVKVSVSTSCSKKRATGSVTVTLTDSDGSTPGQGSAMDVMYPALTNGALANAVYDGSSVIAPTDGSTPGVDTSNLNPIAAKSSKSAATAPPDITIGSLGLSTLTLAIVIASVIFSIIIVVIIIAVVVRAKKRAAEERV